MIVTGVEIIRKYESRIGKTLKDLKEFTSSDTEFKADISKLGEEVEHFMSQFEMPGNDNF